MKYIAALFIFFCEPVAFASSQILESKQPKEFEKILSNMTSRIIVDGRKYCLKFADSEIKNSCEALKYQLALADLFGFKEKTLEQSLQYLRQALDMAKGVDKKEVPSISAKIGIVQLRLA
jgi:CII-binding regulator of phage lambda lysogenization HflD